MLLLLVLAVRVASLVVALAVAEHQLQQELLVLAALAVRVL